MPHWRSAPPGARAAVLMMMIIRALAELTAVAEEAARRGSYVAAHAYSPEAIRHSVTHGIRTIEHGNLLDEETAARIAWVSPLTGRFLVVNRRGVRRMVVSPEELAALVAAGRVELRSSDAPFDEAMRHVWQHLNPKKQANER